MGPGNELAEMRVKRKRGLFKGKAEVNPGAATWERSDKLGALEVVSSSVAG